MKMLEKFVSLGDWSTSSTRAFGRALLGVGLGLALYGGGNNLDASVDSNRLAYATPAQLTQEISQPRRQEYTILTARGQEIATTKIQPALTGDQKLDKALEEIEEAADPNKYGYGPGIGGRKRLEPDGSITLYKKMGEVEGVYYECLDAAIFAQRTLKKYGKKSEVVFGLDEKGLFGNHCWVEMENGLVIDPTPTYPLLGAQHMRKGTYNEERITSIVKREIITFPALSQIVLSYERRGETDYLSTVGLTSHIDPGSRLRELMNTGEDPPVNFTYAITEIADGIPTRIAIRKMTVDVEEFDIRNISLRLGSLRRKIERFRCKTLTEMEEEKVMQSTWKVKEVEYLGGMDYTEKWKWEGQPTDLSTGKDLIDLSKKDDPLVMGFVVSTMRLVELW